MGFRAWLVTGWLGLVGILAAGCGSGPCPEGYCSPEDLVVAQQLYGECSGDSFFPTCLDRSCVEGGEEETYLAITDDVLLGILDGDQAYKDAHFKLNDVSIRSYSDPPKRIFRVDYLFINDWVRIREHPEVRPLDPFDEQTFRERLTNPGYGFRATRKYSRPIPYPELEDKIAACQGTVAEVYWCGSLFFDKETGNMVFGGLVGTIDSAANRCSCLKVNLETGESTCEECVCWVN
ncbi:MAG TPA: hypothetical protein PLC99_20545 [Verrucomicrobiota bacterium]|nr:hypothetical protein [Verrucomicrobiota bacterium]